MARPEAKRERIGDMLVAAGLINDLQLHEALTAQRGSGLPLGKQLVALGHIGEAQFIQVLSNQLSVPWVSIERVQFVAELLDRLPAALADRYCAMPVYVRNLKGKGDTLYVAMDDPSDEGAIAAIARACGMRVKPMIASPSELRRTIELRYFGKEREIKRGSVPTFVQLNKADNEERAPKPKQPPPPPPANARTDGAVPVEHYATPSRPPQDAGRTLTLLDGTRIQLPSAKKSGASQSVSKVRHVVKAVSATSLATGHNAPLRWHDIVQALIDAARARGVTLTRNEVAEAWQQIAQPPEKNPKNA